MCNCKGGKYEKIGKKLGQLVDEKNAAYGDSFNRSLEVLNVFFPNGVSPDQYGYLLTMVRVIDKLFRIATRKDAFGENPWSDIAGYSLLEMAKNDQCGKSETS
jgi:hypothetical protein